MFWGLSLVRLDKAVNTVGTFFSSFIRVGCAIPETRSRIEAAREDRLLGGSSLRTIRDMEPLSRAGTFQELLDKWR